MIKLGVHRLKTIEKWKHIMITVNSIAGVFLYSNDPQKLAEWYTRNFGLQFYSDLPDIPYVNDLSMQWGGL